MEGLGQREGHDPRSWSVLAAPLLAGFAAYLANLQGDDRDPESARLLGLAWGIEGPLASGDTMMSHEFIGRAYATYLDDHRGHGIAMSSPSTRSLIQVRRDSWRRPPFLRPSPRRYLHGSLPPPYHDRLCPAFPPLVASPTEVPWGSEEGADGAGSRRLIHTRRLAALVRCSTLRIGDQ